MKNFYILLFFSVMLFSCENNLQTDLPKKRTDVFSMTAGENIMGRTEYELLRQKNPKTDKLPNNISLKEFNFVNSMAAKNAANFNLQWQQKGPVNVGGRTRALALDIKNENRIFAGGVSGGLWLSEDGGNSFSKITLNTISHSVTSIAQDIRPGFENTWYYGTGEISGNSSDLFGFGIFKSTDNGLTWDLLPSTSNDSANVVSNLGDFRFVHDVKINPVNGDVVAATFAGVFLSQDGGANWQNVLQADASPVGFNYLNFGNQVSVDIDKNGVYYATLSSDVQDRGIWRSLDGLNWVRITPSGFSNAYRRIESAINPFNSSEILFLADVSTNPSVDNHQLWHYTYLNGDGTGAGAIWENRSDNLPDEDCLGFYDFNFGYYQSQNSYDMFIKYHPSQINLVFIGGTNLYRSSDAFSTDLNYEWIGGYQCDVDSPSNYVWPNHHPDCHDAVFLPSNPNIMISAHDGGMSKTQNCASGSIMWESLNNGYGTSQFYTVAIEPGNVDNDIIMGGLQDNGTWHTMTGNPLQPWISTFYGDGSYCAIAQDREAYYVSWQGGKIFKFDIDDNGVVNALTRIDPLNAEDYLFINPFILDPTNNNTMYLPAGNYIWRNDSLSSIPLLNDEYNTTQIGWERINESVSGSSFNIAYISALDMSEDSSDILYYGTFNGSVFKLSGLDDKNYIKESIRVSDMPSGAYVSCIDVNNNNANEVLLSYSNYEVKSIFHTIDGGSSWQDVSGNLEQFEDGSGNGPSVNWVHFYIDDTDTIYFAGTTSGLYVTDLLNGANTIWQREAINVIGNVPVDMIVSRPFDKNITIGTHGNGVYSTKIVDVAVNEINDNNNMVVNFPYPNPANEKVSLNLILTEKIKTEVSVYNMLGQKIEMVNNTTLNTGSHELKWRVSNYENGMYFILIQAGKTTYKRKFMVRH